MHLGLGISPTAGGTFTCYRFTMKGRKIPHLRLAKPYPPTFGCSVCPATFEGPKTRKGLAKEFADHIRRQHPRTEQSIVEERGEPSNSDLIRSRSAKQS